MKVKVESEKVGLKLNIQKTKIMASGPTTSWEIDGETVETVTDFIFLGSKITVDGDCSHEIIHYSERWVIEYPAVIYVRVCFAYVCLYCYFNQFAHLLA